MKKNYIKVLCTYLHSTVHSLHKFLIINVYCFNKFNLNLRQTVKFKKVYNECCFKYKI